MKTTKKKVAKKVVTPNGAITNSKKPLLAKKKPKQSDLRVNAGGNEELFQFLQDAKKKFLEEYKYPTQVPKMTMEEIGKQMAEIDKAYEERNKQVDYVQRHGLGNDSTKVQFTTTNNSDNPSFHFLDCTGIPMTATYPKAEADPEFKPFANIPDTKLTESEYKAIENARMVNKVEPKLATSSPQPPKEDNILELLGSIHLEVNSLYDTIEAHCDKLIPIIGTMEGIKPSEMDMEQPFVKKALQKTVSDIKSLKDYVSDITVAVQNTLG